MAALDCDDEGRLKGKTADEVGLGVVVCLPRWARIRTPSSRDMSPVMAALTGSAVTALERGAGFDLC